jgi:hypothetical protein
VDSVEQGERVERDLDAFIEKRHDQRVREEGERRTLEEWQVSERLYAARKSRARALDWYHYHLERAVGAERNGAEIAASHRIKAARILRTDLGGELPHQENGHEERNGHQESA